VAVAQDLAVVAGDFQDHYYCSGTAALGAEQLTMFVMPEAVARSDPTVAVAVEGRQYQLLVALPFLLSVAYPYPREED